MSVKIDQSYIWDTRFLNLAKEYSTWSKDPSSQIGAVAIEPSSRRVLSGGYNGFPRGIDDTEERLNNRELKHSFVVHAEQNLIYNATRSGISLERSYLYVWGLPVCSECAKGIIQVGVSRVYITQSSIDKSERWKQSWDKTKAMFLESGVDFIVVPGV